jgi:Fe2+ transport system protein FeoA
MLKILLGPTNFYLRCFVPNFMRLGGSHSYEIVQSTISSRCIPLDQRWWFQPSHWCFPFQSHFQSHLTCPLKAHIHVQVCQAPYIPSPYSWQVSENFQVWMCNQACQWSLVQKIVSLGILSSHALQVVHTQMAPLQILLSTEQFHILCTYFKEVKT